MCLGQGVRRLDPKLLPDVTVPCEACGGSRYAPATLEVRYRGLSIADALALRVDEAVSIFAAVPDVARPLAALHEAVLFVDQAEPYFQGAGDNAQARAAILFLRARSLVRDPQRQDEVIDLARRALEIAEQYPHSDLVDAEEVRAWLAQRADIKR